MKKEKIGTIIHKFLNNSASLEEIDFLTKWVEKNKSGFEEEIQLHHLITGALEEENAERLKKDLLSAFDKVEHDKRPKKRNLFLRYAAIFIGFITLGVYLYLQADPKSDTLVKEATITFGDGATKETLNDRAAKIISISDSYIVEQEGTKITYRGTTPDKKELSQLVYNTLDVPYGKKFQLVLSDGTEVYLNSGSSLTYPVTFYDQGPRNVVLRGEAYFTVTSDSLRPFTVNTQFVDAKVLGTEFNISSYEEDEDLKVVLVEGSLSVSQNSTPVSDALMMRPNQLVSYSHANKELSQSNVDVGNYVAWKDGILLFKNEDFYHIAKKLERHYDLSIVIKDIQVSKERYTGRFKTETIEEVLQAFQRIKSFDYSINDNNIKITPKK